MVEGAASGSMCVFKEPFLGRDVEIYFLLYFTQGLYSFTI